MNIKKLVLTGAATALVGGFAFAPNAIAEENPPAAEGHCAPIEEAAPLADVVLLYGEQPGEGQGCLVAEGGGTVPVNPLDDGHIGIYEGSDGNPALYGDCAAREDGAGFTPWDPTAGDTDPAACSPAS